MKKHKLLVCGGTFDLLHKGHKNFLKQILESADMAIIGLTSDSFAKAKSYDIQSFQVRKDNLQAFLGSLEGSYEITEINDIYGPLLGPSIKADAIAVTEDTKKGAEDINTARVEKGLPDLPIIVFDMEKAEDGKPISSARVRDGEINREGRLYVKPSWKGKKLLLPESLRKELSSPFGKLLGLMPENVDPSKTVCVGDVTVRKFNERNVGQLISIVDFIVQRKKEFSSLEGLGFSDDARNTRVENKHGTITQELFNAVAQAFKTRERQIIIVDGEEDLAVIPIILCSPLGFKIYYGQPNQGIVEVIVTEQMKDKVFDLVNKFDLE